MLYHSSQKLGLLESYKGPCCGMGEALEREVARCSNMKEGMGKQVRY